MPAFEHSATRKRPSVSHTTAGFTRMSHKAHSPFPYWPAANSDFVTDQNSHAGEPRCSYRQNLVIVSALMLFPLGNNETFYAPY
jgi:hypothetical protein